MKTTIKKRERFTTISNSILLDRTISFKAKGILIYMLSRPENWIFNAKEISKNSKDGMDSVYSGLKELVSSGYISRKKNSNGTIDYYIFEDKEENDIEDYLIKNPNLKNPNLKNPNLENPNLEKPDVYKRKNTTKERNILNTELKKEKTKNEIDNFINSQDKSEEYKNLLFEFVKYRKKIKDNVKTTGPIKLLLKYFSDEIALKEALEYMDLYNWKTAEPDWIEKKKKGNNYGNNSKNRNDFIVTEESLAETFGRYK